ncbi:MAG TPA: hypothetical protein VJY35_14700 [Candidatus Eisenbacteria bacterium]|nr:hypothetical protein [Candidatus Eisenbacteria bacterium]
MKSHTMFTGGALALASIALVCLAVGCGQEKKHASSTTRAVASGNASPDLVAASAPSAMPIELSQESQTGADEEVAKLGDAPPPEVTASVADTLVIPGTIIDITAEGSPDVTEVTLSDGIGRKQAFTYDAGSALWHTSYRVPMRVPERLGLSVTATNSLSRWRRVWVFVGAAKPAVQEEPEVSEK